MGLTWNDIETIPAIEADKLLLLHSEIEKKEKKDLKKRR